MDRITGEITTSHLASFANVDCWTINKMIAPYMKGVMVFYENYGLVSEINNHQSVMSKRIAPNNSCGIYDGYKMDFRFFTGFANFISQSGIMDSVKEKNEFHLLTLQHFYGMSEGVKLFEEEMQHIKNLKTFDENMTAQEAVKQFGDSE